MSASKDQLARMLALAPYLQKHGAVPLQDLADTFGVSTRQMLEDLQVLYMCGLPGLGFGDLIEVNVESLEENPTGRVTLSNADYLGRPTRLGATEAQALLVALRALAESSPSDHRDVIQRTYDKLSAALGARDVVIDVQVPRTPGIREVADTLSRAITSDRQVRIEYHVPARDETTSRDVDPVAVLDHEGRTYLDAWCHLAGARRLFRVDRILAVEALESSREHADLEPRDLGKGLYEPAAGDLLVRLRLAPSLRWFIGYHPVDRAVEGPDGCVDVDLSVRDTRWLLRLLVQHGTAMTVLEPAHLGDEARVLADEVLRLQRATA